MLTSASYQSLCATLASWIRLPTFFFFNRILRGVGFIFEELIAIERGCLSVSADGVLLRGGEMSGLVVDQG